jgi:hypothetical protein
MSHQGSDPFWDTHFPRRADGERRARERFAGLISRRRMQYLSSLNRRRAFGHGGGV